MWMCKDIKRSDAVARGIEKRFLLLPLVILAMLAGRQAFAANSVELKLSAKIEKSCSISRRSGGSTTLSSDKVVAEVFFTVDCNTPFTYSISSKNNGEGLVHESASGQSVGTNSDSMLTKVPYKTTFKVNLEDGAVGDPSVLEQTCKSVFFKKDSGSKVCDGDEGRDFANSGTSVAIDEQASLKIELDGTYRDGVLDGVPLLAGTFKDTITLKVSVDP